MKYFPVDPNLLTEFVVYQCCPGWVKTDMGGPNATLTPDEGKLK